MTLLFAGYFPKRIVRRDPWLAAPHVDEIWSVSECMSKGPRGWIDRWRHNDFWLFDSVGLAESVVPKVNARATAFSAIAFGTTCSRRGEAFRWPTPARQSAYRSPKPSFAFAESASMP